MAVVALPIGPLGGAMHLGIDPLGAAFLLLLFVAAISCVVFSDAEPAAASARLPASQRARGGSHDRAGRRCLHLGAGSGGLGFAGWLLLSPRPDEGETGLARGVSRSRRFRHRLPDRGTCSDGPAFGSVARLRLCGDTSRAAGRMAGVRRAVAGPAGCDGSGRPVPTHAWIPRLGNAAALLVGVGANIGAYLMFRFLLDLCGTAQPLWWGVPLLLIGASAAVLGPLLATFETRLEPVSCHRIAASDGTGSDGPWRGAVCARRGPAAGRLARARRVLVAAGDPCAMPDPAAALRRCGAKSVRVRGGSTGWAA